MAGYILQRMGQMDVFALDLCKSDKPWTAATEPAPRLLLAFYRAVDDCSWPWKHGTAGTFGTLLPLCIAVGWPRSRFQQSART